MNRINRSNFIDDIEVLRAFAILLVFFGHLKSVMFYLHVPYAREFYSIFGGGKGVHLFFVISGFVIGKGLLPKLEGIDTTSAFSRISIAFWIRRFWRLTPSAWLWLIIPFFLCLTFNQFGHFGTFKGNFAGLAAGFLNVFNIYFDNIFGNGEYSNGMFVHWTLSLEVQFYFILPFIIYFARKRLPLVLILLVVLQLFIFSKQLKGVLRTDGFFIGVLLAIWQQRNNSYRDFDPFFLNNSTARMLFISLLLFGLMVMSVRLNIVPNFYRVSVALIISTFAVWAASYNKDYLVRTKWMKAIFLWVGSRSYVIYLIHIPVFLFMKELYSHYFPKVPPT